MAVSGTKAVEASAVAGEFAAAAAIGVGGSEKSGSSSSGSGGGGCARYHSVALRAAPHHRHAAGEDRLPRLAFVPEPLAEAGEERLEIGDLVDLEGVLGDIGVGGRVDSRERAGHANDRFCRGTWQSTQGAWAPPTSLPGARAFGHGLLVRYLILKLLHNMGVGLGT